MASESDRRRLDVDWNVEHLYPYVPRPPLERRPRDADTVATVHPDYDTYSRFVAHLPTYLTGAPAHTTMSESLFLEHDPDREVSFSRGPYGYFVTFGQRNAWPSTDPGPSPFETEAPTTAPSEVFLGDDQGLWPGATWYDPSRPESLTRLCPAPGSRLADCALWAWPFDDRLFLTARQSIDGQDARYTLSSQGFAALTHVSRDVVALSCGATQLFDQEVHDTDYYIARFPPAQGTSLSREDLVLWMDEWRSSALRVLSWAVLLLRAVPPEQRRWLAPPGWIYPSHPDLSFHAAAAAYGVWDAPLAEVIIDGRMPANRWPPLAHREFGRVPFRWTYPSSLPSETAESAADLTPAWLDPGWEGWDRVHDLDALSLDPAVRAAVADGIRRDVELARFGAWTEYYLVRGGAHGEGSRCFWTTVREGRRDWSGISIARISEHEVRRRHLHDRMLILRNFPYARALTFLAWSDRNRTDEWSREMFDSDVESDEDEDDISDLPVMTPVNPAGSLWLRHPAPPRHAGPTYAGFPPNRLIAPVGLLTAEWEDALRQHYDRLHAPAPAPPSPPLTDIAEPADQTWPGSPVAPEVDTPPPTTSRHGSVAPLEVPGPSSTRGRTLARRASTESMVSLGDEDDTDGPTSAEAVLPAAVDSKKRQRSSSPPAVRPAPAPPSRASSTPSPTPSKGKGKARTTASEDERERERQERATRRANASTRRRRERRKRLEAQYLSRQPRAQVTSDTAPGPSTRRQEPVIPNDLVDDSDAEDREESQDGRQVTGEPPVSEPDLLSRMRLNIRGAAAREASMPALALRMDGAPVALLSGPSTSSSSEAARIPPPIYSPGRRPMARTPGWTAAPSRWSSSPLPLVPTDWRTEIAALSPRVVDSVPGVSWPQVQLPSVETSVALEGIIVLSEHGLLRYRHWRSAHADGATDEFVRWMVQRGVRWDHGARGRISAPPTTASFAGAPDAPPAWSDWLLQVEDLLALPRARHFIRDGGIAWRLALEFGPPNLVASVFSGPSTEARSPLPGEQWAGEGIVVDRPTTEDYELLIGRAGGRSWWPHPDEWDANVGPGEWTLGLERWFQARLRGTNVVDGHDVGTPRLPVADGAWRAHLNHALHARQRHLLSQGEGRVLPYLLALAEVSDAMRRLDLD
ncbi:unnamed protein product [Peniophora sp. CBMAI 1063]|nr:unnamed protein product [Peniophora sp. CBMAI 1063]